MIDTVGRGIKMMYTEQRKRFFPMPDYEINNEIQEVAVTIYGKVIDQNYTTILKENTELSLDDCILLDAVQKHRSVTADAIKYLKGKKLIEGRSPNYRISAAVARMTHQLPSYTRSKGLDKEKAIQLTLQLLKDAGEVGAVKKDIYELLENVLSDMKNEEQKQKYVSNLLSEIKNKRGEIRNVGRRWYYDNSTKK